MNGFTSSNASTIKSTSDREAIAAALASMQRKSERSKKKSSKFDEFITSNYSNRGKAFVNRRKKNQKSTSDGEATNEEQDLDESDVDGIACTFCKGKQGEESMLLCDLCDKGYHMRCLEPPLLNIPVGKWFCFNCSSNTVEQRQLGTSIEPQHLNGTKQPALVHQNTEEFVDAETAGNQAGNVHIGKELAVKKSHISPKKIYDSGKQSSSPKKSLDSQERQLVAPDLKKANGENKHQPQVQKAKRDWELQLDSLEAEAQRYEENTASKRRKIFQDYSEKLHEKIDKLTNQVEILKQEKAELTSDNYQFTKNKTQLEAQIKELKKTIDELQPNLETLTIEELQVLILEKVDACAQIRTILRQKQDQNSKKN